MIVRVLAALSLTLAGCTAALPSPSIAPTASSVEQAALVYVLLSDGQLLVANVDDGKILANLVLAESSPDVLRQVHAMALSGDGETVYVLVQDAGRNGRIAAVDTATHRVVRTIDVGSGADYRSLALGRSSGALYVFGNENGAAVVWIVDPRGASARRLLARQTDGRTWSVYQGVVNADETALFISYHGPTTGIDRFELKDGTLTRCAPATSADQGCIRTHGGMLLFRDRLFAATGEGPLLALDPATGARLERHDPQLEGNHIVEFAVDEVGERLFIIGSCGYARGLATVDLRRGVTQVLAPSRRDSSPCGERIALTPDGHRLVVVQTARPVPTRGRPGHLLVLSDAGSVIRQIPTSAEAIDLLVVLAR